MNKAIDAGIGLAAWSRITVAAVLFCRATALADCTPAATEVGGDIPLGLPFRPGEHYVVTQGYCQQGGDHSGYQVDFAVPLGTPIVACSAGIVVELGTYSGNCTDVATGCGLTSKEQGGLFVKIQHPCSQPGFAWYSSYLHLSSQSVTVGQHVDAGQTVGLSGNTGLSTAPHLHFHIRKGPTDNPLDVPENHIGVRPTPMWGLEMETATSPILTFTEKYSYQALPPPTPITSIMSPIVSYQYPEDFSSAVLANGGIMSPIASYQYFEWPGDSVLSMARSLPVSYFYQNLTGSGLTQVVLQGRVVDANGTGIPATAVSATIRSMTFAQSTTDAQGYYQLPPLPTGNYMLQATAAGYGGSSRVLTLSGSTASQDFLLTPLPTAPAMQQTTRQAPTAFTQPRVGPMGSTLKMFNGSAFVDLDANNKPSPSLMTIVLTHGWTQDPLCGENTGIRGWPIVMAVRLRSNGVAPGQVNILGWDWCQAAYALPLPPEENTPSQGLALGQALQVALGANYSHPVHFVGHSLGTLVNAAAANYLHGDLTAQQGVAPTPWAWQRTHMTLFDQAEAARVVSAQTLFDGWTIDLGNPAATLMYAANTLRGWKPSMPVHSLWADSYISCFGFYAPNAFNIALQKPTSIWGYNLVDAHGYPMVWYGLSIITPTDTAAGFQQSCEYDLKAGLPDSVFPPALLQVGDAYHQTPSSLDPLALEPLPPENVFQVIVPVLGNKADIVVQGAVGVVHFAGDVAADVWDGVQATDRFVSQGFAYVGNVAAQGGQAVVNLYDSAVLHLTFRTGQRHPNGGPHPLDLSPTPMAWVPVSIPSGLPVMAFDFTVQGGVADDVIVCGIGETNLFSLEAKYVPTNAISASRLIDVSQWSGQQVELFFGLMGGTSSNATLEVDNIRFYSLQPPRLEILSSGSGMTLLSWPSTAAGAVVESSTDLSAPVWQAITNPPVISADCYVLTNTWSDQTRFFRLRPR